MFNLTKTATLKVADLRQVVKESQATAQGAYATVYYNLPQVHDIMPNPRQLFETDEYATMRENYFNFCNAHMRQKKVNNVTMNAVPMDAVYAFFKAALSGAHLRSNAINGIIVHRLNS